LEFFIVEEEIFDFLCRFRRKRFFLFDVLSDLFIILNVFEEIVEDRIWDLSEMCRQRVCNILKLMMMTGR